jgi:ribonuclease-3
MDRQRLDRGVGFLALPEFWEENMRNHSQGVPGVDIALEFARSTDVDFKDHLLLRRALTHSSYLNEHPEALEDNERLEFLGDAILDFLVGAWLYHQFPEMREGELTRLRSALVRTEQLAAFARQIDLGSLMFVGRGEDENGGRQRDALLCATFEAVIGAIYLDQGMVVVSRFIEPLLSEAVNEILAFNREKDPKSLLQEWAQAQGYGPPVYRLVTTTGPEHAKQFEVEVMIDGKPCGRGVGNSKQAATKAAAHAKLDSLGLINL